MSGTTTINCPSGFFLNDSVTPATVDDLESAVANALANTADITGSVTAAAASAADATASAAAAAGSQSSASTSEAAAGNSATSADASATLATTQATNAAASATAAANSATTAAGSVTAAATSETNAAASATAASNSASAAATSATSASTSESAAATSATDADNSATIASNKAATIPVTTGNALNFIRINSAGTAYEVRTPAEVATDIGAGSGGGTNVPVPTVNNELNFIRIDSGGLAYEVRAPSQVVGDIGAAPLASPALTGTPTAPTAAANTNTTQLASTAFVLGQASATTPAMDGSAAVGTGTTFARADHVHPSDTSRAALASPTFTGTPAAPTATAGTNTTQIATTAFVHAADALLASLASPALTGTPTAPTAAAGTNTTQLATTAFVHSYAPLASPALTGTPTAPTATVGTNTTQLATTAFVLANGGGGGSSGPAENLLHNPLFNIQQRGAGPFTANDYMLDRWAFVAAGTGASFSAIPVALSDADRTAIGDEEARNALQIAMTSGTDAGTVGQLWQRMEGLERVSGKTVTISFWAKASVASQKVGVSVDLLGGSGSTGTGTAVTLTTSWARYNVTQTLPSSAGFGTLPATDCAELNLWISSGSSFATNSGFTGLQSATFTFWGMQFEIGSSVSALSKPDPADDWARCRRFYQTGEVSFNMYADTASVTVGSTQSLLIGMRAVPTYTTSWGTLTNGTGNILAFDESTFEAWSLSTAAGDITVRGSYTASADL